MIQNGKELWERLFRSDGFRPILQSEGAECGLACLCMIAAYFGHYRTLSELRREFGVSMKGLNFLNIMDTAEKIGFLGRPVRLEVQEIMNLKTPCILHWELQHFVVLVKANKRFIEIYDPARGKRKVFYNQIGKYFTGVAMEFTPTPKFEKKIVVERVKLSDMWSSMHGVSKFLLQLIGLSVCVQLFSTASPILNQIITDNAIANGDQSLLLTISMGIFIMLLIQGLIDCLQGFIGLYMGTQLSFQLRTNLLNHALKLPISWFEKRHLGDILSRFGSLDAIQKFVTVTPVQAIINVVMAIISLTMMLIYSRGLTAIMLGAMGVNFLSRSLSFPIIRRWTDESMSLGARANTVFMETLRGARTFKQFNKQLERVVLWQNEQVAAVNTSVNISKINILGGAGYKVVSGVQGLLLWFFGAKAIIAGTMTLGMLFAFQSFGSQFSSSITSLAGVYFDWKTLQLHLERLADVVHEDIESDVDDTQGESRDLVGSITTRNLGFRYSPHENLVFANVDANVAAGEFAAIVGPTGGGKSTFLKILMGLMPPTEGQVLVDGVELSRFGLKNFRRQIGIVMQDDRLFQGTIADNVSFFDPVADEAKIRFALHNACVYEEVLKMPMGLQTLVGDLGTALSGGQGQRVLIARALYRDPKVLFLDEGTSHLDLDTERRIADNLRNLQITRISVSHRAGAIEGATRIFTVSNGAVVETAAA